MSNTTTTTSLVDLIPYKIKILLYQKMVETLLKFQKKKCLV